MTQNIAEKINSSTIKLHSHATQTVKYRYKLGEMLCSHGDEHGAKTHKTDIYINKQKVQII